jgi:hypothetical protein
MTRIGLSSLLAATAIALLAFTGVASADLPTSPTGTPYEGSFHASSEGNLTVDNPIKTIECSSTLQGEIEVGVSGEPVSIPLTSAAFTGCTNSWHLTAVAPGTLEVHGLGATKNGTVTWSGATIEATRFGVNCRYKTQETHIGALTSSKTTGGTATLDLSGGLPFHSGSALCGAGPTPVRGSYSVGTPDSLEVDGESGGVPTSPVDTVYTGNLHASSEGHIAIHSPIAKNECNSTLEGEVEAHSSSEPIIIPLTTATFTGCTNLWELVSITPGTLEVHGIAGSSNGTVTWSGATITFFRFGITCVYRAEDTHIGTLTGSDATGGTATLDLSGKLPIHGGSSVLCGKEPGSLTGSYSIETPDYLDVDL